MRFTQVTMAATSALMVMASTTTEGKTYMSASMEIPGNGSMAGVSYTTESGTNVPKINMMWWKDDMSNNDTSTTTKRSTYSGNSRISARQTAATITATTADIQNSLSASLATLIGEGLIGNDLESGFTKLASTNLCNANPSNNVIVFKTGNGALTPSLNAPAPVMGTSKALGGTLIQGDIVFNAFVFQGGVYNRNGDGGDTNLQFCGTFSVSGANNEVITFT